jgi:4-hydroxyphenylpyruvate dioxygenase
LTTGSRTEASLLTQGNIRFLLTTSLRPTILRKEVQLYGDGIKDIAFTVDDATATSKL